MWYNVLAIVLKYVLYLQWVSSLLSTLLHNVYIPVSHMWLWKTTRDFSSGTSCVDFPSVSVFPCRINKVSTSWHTTWVAHKRSQVHYMTFNPWSFLSTQVNKVSSTLLWHHGYTRNSSFYFLTFHFISYENHISQIMRICNTFWAKNKLHTWIHTLLSSLWHKQWCLNSAWIINKYEITKNFEVFIFDRSQIQRIHPLTQSMTPHCSPPPYFIHLIIVTEKALVHFSDPFSNFFVFIVAPNDKSSNFP